MRKKLTTLLYKAILQRLFHSTTFLYFLCLKSLSLKSLSEIARFSGLNLKKVHKQTI